MAERGHLVRLSSQRELASVRKVMSVRRMLAPAPRLIYLNRASVS